GNDDTVDVLLFDNNHVVTRGDRGISNQFSRAVQYRINEKEKTVSEVWSYGEERGEAFYSEIIGNAQYLPDTGNRLITSGYIDPGEDSDERISKVVETNDEKDADVVFEITLPDLEKYSGKYDYRAVRMTLYTSKVFRTYYMFGCVNGVNNAVYLDRRMALFVRIGSTVQVCLK